MKRPYIGGQMTGRHNNNYARFAYLLRALRAAGIDAQSPHLLEANIPNSMKGGMSKGEMYRMVMPGDVYMLSTCDGMICMPGWAASEGTQYERDTAALFRLPIIDGPPTCNEEMGDALERPDITPAFRAWCDTIIQEIQCESS